MSVDDFKNYMPTLVNLISKIQFHNYNKEQLTVEIITNTLDSNILSKLHGTIGFIGA